MIYYAANCLSLKEVGNIFKKHHTSIIHNRDVVENVVKNPIYDIDLYNEYIRVGNYIKMACNEAA